LLHLDLVRTAGLGRAVDRVVFRMVEVVDVVRVQAELAGEVFRVEDRLGLTAVAVQPREVGECERFGRLRFGNVGWCGGSGAVGRRLRGGGLRAGYDEREDGRRACGEPVEGVDLNRHGVLPLVRTERPETTAARGPSRPGTREARSAA